MKIFKMADIVYKEKFPLLGSCPNKFHLLATAWIQKPQGGAKFWCKSTGVRGGGGEGVVMDEIDTCIIKM